MLDNPTIYVTAVTTPTFERRETTKANTSIKTPKPPCGGFVFKI